MTADICYLPASILSCVVRQTDADHLSVGSAVGYLQPCAVGGFDVMEVLSDCD